MNFDYNHYVPCLRWKMGEYQAVWRLTDTTKKMFTPLIQIPELGWDFENKTKAQTIDEHLAPFAKRVYAKWGRQPCFVDLNLIAPSERMENGIHPVRFIFDDLRAINSQAIPVTALHRDKAYQTEVKRVLSKDGSGACLRVPIELSAKSTFKTEIDSLLSTLEIKPSDCDFILDLGSPNFVPLEGFLMVIQNIVSVFPYLNDWRTFTLLGTSFPETMSSIKKGGEIIPRHEWRLYKMFVDSFREAGLRLPSFGDYAISHPKVFTLDMRLVKPYATIRYTVDDAWYIIKGENVRDHGFSQYRKLSQRLQESRRYCGPNFSWGDEYIQKCANGGKTGNLTMWRQVGTNHHIVKVIQDIASFYAS